MEGLSERKACLEHRQTNMSQQHPKLKFSPQLGKLKLLFSRLKAVSLGVLIDFWKIISM